MNQQHPAQRRTIIEHQKSRFPTPISAAQVSALAIDLAKRADQTVDLQLFEITAPSPLPPYSKSKMPSSNREQSSKISHGARPTTDYSRFTTYAGLVESEAVDPTPLRPTHPD